MVHDLHQGDQNCTTAIGIETLCVLVPKSIGKSVLKRRYLCKLASSSVDSDCVFACFLVLAYTISPNYNKTKRFPPFCIFKSHIFFKSRLAHWDSFCFNAIGWWKLCFGFAFETLTRHWELNGQFSQKLKIINAFQLYHNFKRLCSWWDTSYKAFSFNFRVRVPFWPEFFFDRSRYHLCSRAGGRGFEPWPDQH